MEDFKEKRKKLGLLKKTWDRCKSFNQLHSPKQPISPTTTSNNNNINPMLLKGHPMVKSKSWSTSCPPSPSYYASPRLEKQVTFRKTREDKMVPNGCFSVHVGPDRQRFVIKIECTNHPLFKTLLEEAELEYGYHSDGPLVLPCDVNIFIKVLAEIEGDDDDANITRSRCSLTKNRNSYHHLSSPRLLVPLQ